MSAEAFDWRDLAGETPTGAVRPERPPGRDRTRPVRADEAHTTATPDFELGVEQDVDQDVANLEWSAPADGTRAEAEHALLRREVEAQAGAHVSEGDPLRVVGLVVAAGMHVMQAAERLGGAHVSEDDPLLTIEHRAAHAVSDQASRMTPRGAHVREDDPLLVIEHRARHAASGPTALDAPRGAHVSGDDPLRSVERRAVHALKSTAQGSMAPAANRSQELVPAKLDSLQPAPLASAADGAAVASPTTDIAESHNPVVPIDALMQGDMSTSSTGDAPHDGAASDGAATAEAVPLESAGRDPSFGMEVRKSLQRDIDAGAPVVELAPKRQSARASARRRWRLVPVAGAAGAVVAGLGGGTAVAFITTHGSGSTDTVTGSPVAVTIAATAGTADLLPGQGGAVTFTLHNPGTSSATLNEVLPGVSIVSDNAALCASDEVRIAPALPYTLPTPITVSPGTTSGSESIGGLVALAPGAPSTCQGVTFNVNFTLSGRSS